MVVEEQAQYPTLRRPRRSTAEVAQRYVEAYGGTVRVSERIMATAQMDLQRQMVSLFVSKMDEYGNMAVLVPQWEAVTPGEMSPVPPIYLNERDAQQLTDSLDQFNRNRRRMEETLRQYEDMRSEMRSLSNQLEEVRNHRDTLADTNRFLTRQVTWLERELRDSNRERRGQPLDTPRPEPVVG